MTDALRRENQSVALDLLELVQVFGRDEAHGVERPEICEVEEQRPESEERNAAGRIVLAYERLGVATVDRVQCVLSACARQMERRRTMAASLPLDGAQRRIICGESYKATCGL